jgi:hypothetical protein
MTRTVNGHADQGAVGGDERAAFRRHCEPHVETQLGIDLPAVGAVPRSGGEGNDPERRDDVALRSADCEGEMAGLQTGCNRRGRDGRLGSKTQHGYIGGRIAAGQRRFDAASVRERQREIGVALYRFLGGDDEAGLPDDAARGHPPAAVNGHHCFRSRIDGGCEMS